MNALNRISVVGVKAVRKCLYQVVNVQLFCTVIRASELLGARGHWHRVMVIGSNGSPYWMVHLQGDESRPSGHCTFTNDPSIPIAALNTDDHGQSRASRTVPDLILTRRLQVISIVLEGYKINSSVVYKRDISRTTP